MKLTGLMPLGEKIRYYRKQKGMTQQELADKLHISYVGISQYETGKRNPKLETMSRIADALDIPVKLLYGSIEEYISQGQSEKVKASFVSDKSTRLSCKIDSGLYDTLATLADENDRTLEDEVEERLYWSVENDMEEYQNAKNAQEEQMQAAGSHHDD